MAKRKIKTTISPLLYVKNGAAAIAFYKKAFGAIELMRVDGPEGIIVAELSMDGATFFLADESPDDGNLSPESNGSSTMRIELGVADPDAVAAEAIAAGAREMFPVADHDYGYRQGRIVDPFGHHWVIGRKIASG
jgi:PhnB protein